MIILTTAVIAVLGEVAKLKTKSIGKIFVFFQNSGDWGEI